LDVDDHRQRRIHARQRLHGQNRIEKARFCAAVGSRRFHAHHAELEQRAQQVGIELRSGVHLGHFRCYPFARERVHRLEE
jgi:hypothetical protein